MAEGDGHLYSREAIALNPRKTGSTCLEGSLGLLVTRKECLA